MILLWFDFDFKYEFYSKNIKKIKIEFVMLAKQFVWFICNVYNLY